MIHTVEVQLGSHKLSIETGLIAKQAGGSVIVRYGDSVVLVTAQARSEASENKSFLPLSVDYTEKTYAAGRIPGGFFKREGRPTDREILTSRLIDRPIRPLFPEGYFNETQVIATVMSADEKYDPDFLGIIGASAALTISPYPFQGPIAGVRVGRVDGKLIINPSMEERDLGDLDLMVAGTKDAIVMVEGGAKIVPESVMIDALIFAHEQMQPVIKIQEELHALVQNEQWDAPVCDDNTTLYDKVNAAVCDRMKEAVTISEKQSRYAAIDALKTAIVSELVAEEDDDSLTVQVKAAFSDVKKSVVRKMIVNEKKRIDGRGLCDVRPIDCQIGLLPRAHGSALFTRGETQSLVATTLGTKGDEQLIENITGEHYNKFMLHYNFPPYSVGEVKFLRGASRREIGHGTLAARAISAVLPEHKEFPYTIRIVSEIMESNGSSSMASVCGGILSLMHAGVPISSPVAGVAMGLIEEDGQKAVLTDILGDEDHLGDMDFKVTGTREGITALQMDIKISGITRDVLTQALNQAKDARLHILDCMEKTISTPSEELSPHAPKLIRIQIPVNKIGDLIGPGGKNIRKIVDETGATVDIEEDGTVVVGAVSQESGNQALAMVKALTASAEVGQYYNGKVVRIADFGAFVEILPKQDGLLHISQIDNERVNQVSDVLKVGDRVVVKVIEVDQGSGKIRLSRKQAFGHENEVQ